MGKRLSSPTFYVLPREIRLRAYDHAGIPADLHPSRATLYRIAEDMGADYVVLGYYTFDGRIFTATAQLLDMRHQKLWPEARESGPLVQLIDLQTALAWDILRVVRPDSNLAREAFLSVAPPVRLDALENYVRGILATTAPERINRFREALRLSPAYSEAQLALGKAYFGEHEYDQVVAVLSHFPAGDPPAREANFYVGLAAYYLGDYEHAESGFQFVAARLPLPEVYNNLGVVASRRGRKNAVEFFQKASEDDPSDPDYHFNLAVATCRAGDFAAGSRHAREALALRPNDTEAKALLDTATTTNPKARGAASRLPMERIRTNYDESSFRQLSLQISAVAEQRLTHADARTHAQFHTDRGRELLSQGFVAESEKDLREAVSLDPSNADAHSALARILSGNNDLAGARSEAETALRLKSSAETLVLLAELDLRENKSQEAEQSVEQALKLEPANQSALALKRAIAAKLAEKAQPLPN
jgi:tetratricopeptide (TPR) repeat protein